MADFLSMWWEVMGSDNYYFVIKKTMRQLPKNRCKWWLDSIAVSLFTKNYSDTAGRGALSCDGSIVKLSRNIILWINVVCCNLHRWPSLCLNLDDIYCFTAQHPKMHLFQPVNPFLKAKLHTIYCFFFKFLNTLLLWGWLTTTGSLAHWSKMQIQICWGCCSWNNVLSCWPWMPFIVLRQSQHALQMHLWPPHTLLPLPHCFNLHYFRM